MSKVQQKNLIRRNLILRSLLDHGPLSPSELKIKTGVSLPVVISLINSLKEENLLVDVVPDQPKHAGRPPLTVRLNGEAGYILGVDIGRVNSNFVLLDLAQNIISDVRRKSVRLSNDITVVHKLQREIEIILGEAGVSWSDVLGVGLSLPGIVQGREGLSHTYLNFGEEPLRDFLSARFRKPVHVEHDVKAMALGEMWFGAAKGLQNVLCVNVGWGLGLGMIIDGRVYYGEQGFSGELGHMQVEPEGNLCYCGKKGCLETYASGKSIARQAQEKMVQEGRNDLFEKYGNGATEIDARVIMTCAEAGDEFCIEIIEGAALKLGYGLAQILNVFNPEKVIFGGRLSMVDSFFNAAITAAKQFSMDHIHAEVVFEKSELGHRSGALGVGVLAARDLFEVEHLNPQAFV